MTHQPNTRRGESVSETAGEQPGYAKRIARKFGLTLAQAQALILVVGTDLAKLTEAAERLHRKTN